MRALASFFLAILLAGAVAAQSTPPPMLFRVKYVSAEMVYINGGEDDGLRADMELEIVRSVPGSAQIEAEVIGLVKVYALAGHSAACMVITGADEIKEGDTVRLAAADAETVAYLLASKNSRKYAQIVSFSDVVDLHPLEAEQREYVPRPRLAEINRIKGRISMQQSSLFDRTSGTNSLQEGLSIKTDMTRLGGTYWNFNGYWRGRINSRSLGPQQQTLTDLINRTYQIGFKYNNPNSKNVIGVGRLIMPWASSLSTLDGGYYGRRLNRNTTAGAFAGAMPDPTSWNLAPDRTIVGAFTSFEAGSFEKIRYSSTIGAAHTRRDWRPERQFAFFENHISINRDVSIYHNGEFDNRTRGLFGENASGPMLIRSFFTVRAKASEIVSFDISHNHFRGTPTFDTRLLGTGLLDQFLFQGVSGGVRFELPARSAVYANFGRSSQQSDERPSWNYLLGFTLGRVPRLWAMRADVRTSRFESAFGQGNYSTVSLSREINERLRFEVQGGEPNFSSPLTAGTRSRWINSYLDWFVTTHYMLGLGFTYFRGRVQAYDQLFVNFGYRF